MPRDRDRDRDDEDDRPSRPWEKRRREDDGDDRPRRGREEDDDDEDEEDDHPRRRRRRPDREPLDEPGMHYLVPVNTSGLAIAAGYVGLISVLCLPAPIALLLGILALRHLARNPGTHGYPRAIFAVVMGGIFTLVPVAWLIFVAVNER